MSNGKLKHNRLLDRLLAISLSLFLVVGIFPTTSFAVSEINTPAEVNTLAEEALEFKAVDLNALDASQIDIDLLSKKGVDAYATLERASASAQISEEATYVEAVAQTLTSQMGIYGLDGIADEEKAHVFVWLQELPQALEKVYLKEGMSVSNYSTAKQNAQAARSSIRALAGNSYTRGTKAAGIVIEYEYSEVFSGFAIEATLSQIKAISEMPGVYLVTEVGTMYEDAYTPDPDYSVNGNASAREILRIGELHETVVDGVKLDGTGVKVGVIDSGIDATHPDLAGAYKGGYNFTNDPFTGKSNNMSRPSNDHGTHVAGVIASQGVGSLGMAPGVELYAAQVFKYGTKGAAESDILQAIEDFTSGTGVSGLPKVDIVNMSLGADVNTAYSAQNFAVNNGTIAGVSFVLSAGNNAVPEREPTQRNAYTLGTPSTSSLAITVAASMYGGMKLYHYASTVTSENGYGTMEIMVENADNILLSDLFRDGSFGGGTNPPQYINDKGYELYYACGSTDDMTAAEMTALSNKAAGSLQGKILVVNRGQSFVDYKAQAIRLGASALIILNRDESFIGNMDIANETASDDFIIFSGKLSSRQLLLDLVNGGETAYLNPAERVDVHTALEPAGFSSIGPVSETAEIKPDVIAPGYSILSTTVTVNEPQSANESTYGPMSGTSMAAPCVTGVLALVKQVYSDETPSQLKARLMSTADRDLLGPSTSYNQSSGKSYFNENGTEISIWEQGAGFINPYRAIMNDSGYITVSSEVPEGGKNMGTMTADMSSFSFGVARPGDTTEKLTATVHGISDYSVSIEYRNNTRYSVSSQGAIEVKYAVNGDTFEVWLEIAEGLSLDPAVGNLYEGYVVVTANGNEYAIPWGVRIGEPPTVAGVGDDWLIFPDRPIQATYNNPNQDLAPYSSQNNIYFVFDSAETADSVVVRRAADVGYMDILLFDVDNPTVPAYRYPVYLGDVTKLSQAIDLEALLYVPTDAYATKRNADGSWAAFRTAVVEGSYYIGLEFDIDGTRDYIYYLQLGVHFSNTRPTLSFSDVTTSPSDDTLGDITLTEHSNTYSLYEEGASEYTIEGRIYSPAINSASNAGQTGFFWAGYYLLQYGVIVPLDQSFNTLQDTQYGFPVAFDNENLYICDEDGYFSLTFDTPSVITNSYAISYDINTDTGEITWSPSGSRHSVRGADAFDIGLDSYLNMGVFGNQLTYNWTPYTRQANAGQSATEALVTLTVGDPLPGAYGGPQFQLWLDPTATSSLGEFITPIPSQYEYSIPAGGNQNLSLGIYNASQIISVPAGTYNVFLARCLSGYAYANGFLKEIELEAGHSYEIRVDRKDYAGNLAALDLYIDGVAFPAWKMSVPVPAPMPEAEAATEFETDTYTGTVSWIPNDEIFNYETEYRAIVTLTPKDGYDFSQVFNVGALKSNLYPYPNNNPPTVITPEQITFGATYNKTANRPLYTLDEALNVEGGTLGFVNTGGYPWVGTEKDGKISAKTTNYHITKTNAIVKTTAELAAGEIVSFEYFVSSDYYSDIFTFKVNGEAVFKASGTDVFGQDVWKTFVYAVRADGEYELEWSYVKNTGVSAGGTGEDTCWLANVYAGEGIPVESITITGSNFEIPSPDRSITIPYEILPANADDKEVTWSSDNTSVATVKDGVVFGVSVGTATITVESADGEYSDSCQVTVLDGERPVVFYAFDTHFGGWYTFTNEADLEYNAIFDTLVSTAQGYFIYAAEYVAHTNTIYGFMADPTSYQGVVFFATTLDDLDTYNVISKFDVYVHDMAYDYSTGIMYALCAAYTDNVSVLYTVDLETGELTRVGTFPGSDAKIKTLAISTDGVGYGLTDAFDENSVSKLYKIDLETSECTLIGSTGQHLNYDQSMAYNHNTGELYWTYYWESSAGFDSRLLLVDTETGEVTFKGYLVTGYDALLIIPYVDMSIADTTLSALTISQGTLDPVFNPETTSYTAIVGNAINSVEVTATVNDENAVCEINGTVGSSKTVNLDVGENTISVVVTAQNGTSNTYTIIVTREAAPKLIGLEGVNGSSTMFFDKMTEDMTDAFIQAETQVEYSVNGGERTELTARNFSVDAATMTASFEFDAFERDLYEDKTITVYVSYNGEELSFVFELNKWPVVTSVTVSASALTTIKVKSVMNVSYTVTPADAEESIVSVEWTSSNATIASVEDGVITGLKAGTVTITLKITTVHGTVISKTFVVKVA